MRQHWGVLALAGALVAAGCRDRRDAGAVAPRHEVTREAAPSPGASAGAKAPAGAIGVDASEFPYSHPVKVFELQSQRQTLRMAYVDVASPKPNGKTVLLLHGKNFSAEYWTPTVRSLSGAGYRVIAPDQIGFGKSSKPERYQYSLLGLAGNTRALLRAAGVEVSAVVGHSMGGMLAARYAVTFPEAVSKLVLVCPLGLEDYGAHIPYRTVDDWYARELAQNPEKIIEYQRQAYYAGEWKPEYAELAALQIGFTKHPDYPRIAYTSALTFDMIVTQPVVHDFPRLRATTLLLVGERDRTAVGRDLLPEREREKLGNFPKLAASARQSIPNARATVLRGTGHLPQVEAFPEYERALLEFLGGP